jgi:hypothetical protein
MMITDGDFYGIIQDTWTSTLGFQVDRPDAAEFSEVGVFTVCVRITGAWDGEVRLHCTQALAKLIAAAIFQVEVEKAENEEILDGLSELIHIIGGNLKALLPKPVTLSLPCLLEPTNWAQTTPQWQMLCRLTLMSEGHSFVVALLGGMPAGVMGQAPTDHPSHLPSGNS